MQYRQLLEDNAAAYAEVALANVRREFPHYAMYVAEGADDHARPRDRHPAFYGSLDWHSCVEMHWVLVRLLRLFPGLPVDAEARRVLDEHLTPERLEGELAFFSPARHRGIERPYGWGWYLALAHEASAWDDPSASRWADALRPLAGLFVERYLEWLPKLTYPQRVGTHPNTAFALTLSLPYAGRELAAPIREAALRWFAEDRDYPAAWEPSGADFLSAALTEAVLMLELLGAGFPAWLDRFLPIIPDSLLEPAVVSDPTDGQIAHLHGLNLSRAWCFRRLSEGLPAEDLRVPALAEAARRHAEASLPAVTGSDYVVEHWLAAYAVLLLAEKS